jgi:hypothetical protein
MVSADLLDRFINIRVLKGENPDPVNDLYVQTPLTGIKPDISVKGSILPGNELSRIEVRIVNLFPEEDLYGYIGRLMQVEAGYKGSVSTAFQCTLLSAPYMEKPTPDSITVFRGVVGNYDIYNSRSVPFRHFAAGQTLRTVLQYVADSVGLTLSYEMETYNLPVPLIVEGIVKDVVALIKYRIYNVFIQLEYGSLACYNSLRGRETFYDMQFVSMVTRSGGGLNITAPWIPTLKSGDTVRINPLAYKQSLGASFVDLKSDQFTVRTIDFAFNTRGNSNSMVVYATTQDATAAVGSGADNPLQLTE